MHHIFNKCLTFCLISIYKGRDAVMQRLVTTCVTPSPHALNAFRFSRYSLSFLSFKFASILIAIVQSFVWVVEWIAFASSLIIGCQIPSITSQAIFASIYTSIYTSICSFGDLLLRVNYYWIGCGRHRRHSRDHILDISGSLVSQMVIKERPIKLDHSGVDVVFASLITFTLIYLSVSLLTMTEVFQSNWILSSVGIISTIHLLVTPIGYFGFNLDHKVMILFFIIGASVWTLLIAFNIIIFNTTRLYHTFARIAYIIPLIIWFLVRSEKTDFLEESPLHLSLIFFYVATTLTAVSLSSVKLLKRRTLIAKWWTSDLLPQTVVLISINRRALILLSIN